jgi:glycosyltransferase involved in cell wall biosynthesis
VAKLALRDRRVNDHYSNARYLRRLAADGTADVLAVATRAYQAYLEQEGVACELVPLGYHPSHGRLLGRERDVSVVFLGDFRLPRRRRILRQLERAGVDILTLGDYANPELWGEGRVELMNRAKIALNIPRLEGHLPDVRLVVAMANGALVVSEPLYLPEPYRPGAHYVEAPVERLAETIRRYLDDDDARQRITEEAYRFVTTELTLDRSFSRLLELAREATLRAA